MKIHAGDSVLIITGKDKGKQGTVIRVLADKDRLVVEGINMRVRHIKKTPQQAGQRVSYEASLHASNVMILDPKTKKPTRIGYQFDEVTGEKKRVARLSGMVLEKAAVAKSEGGSTKKTKSTKSTKSDQASPASSSSLPSSSSSPKKLPFWKRKSSGAKTDQSGKPEEGGSSFTTAHRAQGG